MSAEKACWRCKTTDRELRPYGPGGKWTCFPCGTRSPAQEAETRTAFLSHLALAELAAGSGGVVAIGTEQGPHVIANGGFEALDRDGDQLRCHCGELGTYEELFDDAGLEPCGGLRTTQCVCGGDLCICHNHGETECPGCVDCNDGSDEEAFDEDC